MFELDGRVTLVTGGGRGIGAVGFFRHLAVEVARSAVTAAGSPARPWR